MGPPVSPDNVTYILLLNGNRSERSSSSEDVPLFSVASTVLRDVQRGVSIHKEIRRSLDVPHVHVHNALIDFYGKINRIESAEQIFEQMSLRETSTYNSLMKAYLINRMPVKVLRLFEEMKENAGQSVGPLGFQPDLITFMAVCDACERVGLLQSPESTFEEFSWKTIFAKKSLDVWSFRCQRIPLSTTNVLVSSTIRTPCRVSMPIESFILISTGRSTSSRRFSMVLSDWIFKDWNTRHVTSRRRSPLPMPRSRIEMVNNSFSMLDISMSKKFSSRMRRFSSKSIPNEKRWSSKCRRSWPMDVVPWRSSIRHRRVNALLCNG